LVAPLGKTSENLLPRKLGIRRRKYRELGAGAGDHVADTILHHAELALPCVVTVSGGAC
jgi:hypothetical protein